MVIRAPVSAAIAFCLVADRLNRPTGLGRAKPHVHAHLGPTDQQAVAHVVAGITKKGIGHSAQRLFDMLLHGQEIGEDLGRDETRRSDR